MFYHILAIFGSSITRGDIHTEEQNSIFYDYKNRKVHEFTSNNLSNYHFGLCHSKELPNDNYVRTQNPSKYYFDQNNLSNKTESYKFTDQNFDNNYVLDLSLPKFSCSSQSKNYMFATSCSNICDNQVFNKNKKRDFCNNYYSMYFTTETISRENNNIGLHWKKEILKKHKLKRTNDNQFIKEKQPISFVNQSANLQPNISAEVYTDITYESKTLGLLFYKLQKRLDASKDQLKNCKNYFDDKMYQMSAELARKNVSSCFVIKNKYKTFRNRFKFPRIIRLCKETIPKVTKLTKNLKEISISEYDKRNTICNSLNFIKDYLNFFIKLKKFYNRQLRTFDVVLDKIFLTNEIFKNLIINVPMLKMLNDIKNLLNLGLGSSLDSRTEISILQKEILKNVLISFSYKDEKYKNLQEIVKMIIN